MTKEQFDMVKSLLAQTSFNTTDGDFYLSISNCRYLKESPYVITIFPNDLYKRFPKFDIECIHGVCAVVNAYYNVCVEQGLPVIRIS